MTPTEPIELKATKIQHRYDEIAMEWMVDGRFEIRWNTGEAWVNLGVGSYSLLEWQLITSNHELGARHSGGLIKFTLVDIEAKRVEGGCDDWPQHEWLLECKQRLIARMRSIGIDVNEDDFELILKKR